MSKYVYEVSEHKDITSEYFSSWMKAFKHCHSIGYVNRGYEDVHQTLTQMKNDKGWVTEIRKHVVK